ncbi:iron-sulfur cluster assembly scaffold protein [Microvirga flavescens]|uniref:iron-sulfur cluster assembly scaffold protein n=1 Tax=Microvirga flavescens TaxID=2249811 RepID=UPI000DD6E33F|nr:iron-sulfur cluster assembly scaffold protein [Microvirga flavescens]
MLNQIYNTRILTLAANIRHLGRLADADASATKRSKLCGSTVTVDLKMSDGVVTAFAHQVKACALGQASSAIMAEKVIGSTADELREAKAAVSLILMAEGKPPAGKWADLEVLTPIRDFKERHASVLLTFEAVVDAVEQIEARRAGRAD